MRTVITTATGSHPKVPSRPSQESQVGPRSNRRMIVAVCGMDRVAFVASAFLIVPWGSLRSCPFVGAEIKLGEVWEFARLAGGGDGVEAAVDVDHLAGRLREPVRQEGDARFGDRFGVAQIPAEGRPLGPHILEAVEAG